MNTLQNLLNEFSILGNAPPAPTGGEEDVLGLGGEEELDAEGNPLAAGPGLDDALGALGAVPPAPALGAVAPGQPCPTCGHVADAGAVDPLAAAPGLDAAMPPMEPMAPLAPAAAPLGGGKRLPKAAAAAPPEDEFKF